MHYQLYIHRLQIVEDAICGIGSLCCFSDETGLPISLCSFRTCENLMFAIPAGRYNTTLTFSPKFHKKLPLLDVPNRSGIRIHSGNTSKDTRGCILVGDLIEPFWETSNEDIYPLINSRKTLKKLLDNCPVQFETIIFEDIKFAKCSSEGA